MSRKETVGKPSSGARFPGPFRETGELEIFLLYAGVHATIYYRLAHWLHLHRCRFLARCISQWARFWTGIEIHPGATIGRRLVIDHGAGIVIAFSLVILTLPKEDAT